MEHSWLLCRACQSIVPNKLQSIHFDGAPGDCECDTCQWCTLDYVVLQPHDLPVLLHALVLSPYNLQGVGRAREQGRPTEDSTERCGPRCVDHGFSGQRELRCVRLGSKRRSETHVVDGRRWNLRARFGYDEGYLEKWSCAMMDVGTQLNSDLLVNVTKVQKMMTAIFTARFGTI